MGIWPNGWRARPGHRLGVLLQGCEVLATAAALPRGGGVAGKSGPKPRSRGRGAVGYLVGALRPWSLPRRKLGKSVVL